MYLKKKNFNKVYLIIIYAVSAKLSDGELGVFFTLNNRDVYIDISHH